MTMMCFLVLTFSDPFHSFFPNAQRDPSVPTERRGPHTSCSHRTHPNTPSRVGEGYIVKGVAPHTSCSHYTHPNTPSRAVYCEWRARSVIDQEINSPRNSLLHFPRFCVTCGNPRHYILVDTPTWSHFAGRPTRSKWITVHIRQN